MSVPLRVGLLAGEASGDTLGADLIDALRQSRAGREILRRGRTENAGRGLRELGAGRVPGRHGAVRCAARSAAAGASCWRASSACSWRRGRMCSSASMRRIRICAWRAVCTPPAFRPCSTSVRRCGPGGRAGRAAFDESVDLVLCLLPFEKRFYDEHGIRAEFVGHPLADAIPEDGRPRGGSAHARVWTAVPASSRCLPGSRRGEVARLAADFAATARWLAGAAARA